MLDCACNCGAYLFWAKDEGAGRCRGFDVRAHWIDQARFLQRHRQGPNEDMRFEVMDLMDLPDARPRAIRHHGLHRGPLPPRRSHQGPADRRGTHERAVDPGHRDDLGPSRRRLRAGGGVGGGADVRRARPGVAADRAACPAARSWPGPASSTPMSCAGRPGKAGPRQPARDARGAAPGAAGAVHGRRASGNDSSLTPLDRSLEWPHAPVAQPDRASVYETEGHWFESSRARSRCRAEHRFPSRIAPLRLSYM